ncbi:Protein of unknown function [Octadecabacter temperatus]|uniref:Uncharacterized protein n=1 Tax=Octadecabacter temperatus TaxID=1458307 RepID=A0A0K0Y6N4_9RHOB|nr:DUF1653 domain-containing protein [Octadecabacter temperatus]AKS46633.1 hypothetical protein OSB_20940 [Octadecabacter temperatus]SIO18200.1 Protein of unknown function [Octadecabacter temperatus]
MKKVTALLRRLTDGSGNARWKATHRHRKGRLYRVVGPAILEADRSAVVIYDDADGTVWVRSADEFNDGRFTPL